MDQVLEDEDGARDASMPQEQPIDDDGDVRMPDIGPETRLEDSQHWDHEGHAQEDTRDRDGPPTTPTDNRSASEYHEVVSGHAGGAAETTQDRHPTAMLEDSQGWDEKEINTIDDVMGDDARSHEDDEEDQEITSNNNNHSNTGTLLEDSQQWNQGGPDENEDDDDRREGREQDGRKAIVQVQPSLILEDSQRWNEEDDMETEEKGVEATPMKPVKVLVQPSLVLEDSQRWDAEQGEEEENTQNTGVEATPVQHSKVDDSRRPRFMSQGSKSSSDDSDMDDLERPSPQRRSLEQTPQKPTLVSPFVRGTPRSIPRSDLGGGLGRFVSPSPARNPGNLAPRSLLGGGGGGGGGGPPPGDGGDDDDEDDDDDENQGNNNNQDDDDDSSTGELEDPDNEGFIYMTHIAVSEMKRMFRKFIRRFKLGDEQEPYFIRKLHEIYETGILQLDVDCYHLQTFSAQSLMFYKRLLQHPVEVVVMMDMVVHEEFEALFGNDVLSESKRITVRMFNLHQVRRMRELDPIDLEKLICIRGMIIRVSPITPDLKVAYFQCTMCESHQEIILKDGVIEEPKKCANCNESQCMQLIHNRSIYDDKQMIKLQEAPENTPAGETPNTIWVYAHDSLVDQVKPGDRVEACGIFRAVAMRKAAVRRTVDSTYKTYLDVMHFSKIEKGNSAKERDRNIDGSPIVAAGNNGGDEDELMRDHENNNEDDDGNGRNDETEEQHELRMRQLANDPDIYNKLAQSVAPSIWELDDIKKGLLLLLFGGTNKEMNQEGGVVKSTHRMRSRGEINILLCGDPGTSKSQLLGYVHKLAPRGIYTSGKGSSAVGLTAYVSKDPDTKEIVLESGALVLSDRGVCCIDEFDKMSDTTRAILHECMEQQTISVAKAGIIATLNARTSILASANPIKSRYDPKLPIVRNINLPPTLMSRFDLIYLVLDKPDQVTDRRLAKHLVKLYFKNPPRPTEILPKKTFIEYLKFAKSTCFPELSDQAVRKLIQGYVDIRQLGAVNQGKKTPSATPRQLESIIRLAEAHAKVHLRHIVTEGDVDEALRLHHVATQTAAVDPRTGTIDMDAINTGQAANDREMGEALEADVRAVLANVFPGRSVPFSSIYNEIAERREGVTEDHVRLALRNAVENHEISYFETSRTYQVRAA